MSPNNTDPGPRPISRLQGVQAYRSWPPVTPVDLRLDANEGGAPALDLGAALALHGPDVARRYPDPWAFEEFLAGRLGVEPDRVLVTAGGDDAIDRICRAFLEPGRELVLPTPSFEMIPRYTDLAGARLVEVPWPDGAFPLQAVLAVCGPQTAVVAVVSPNNPTGAVIGSQDLRRLSEALPQTLLLVDLAYAEFADEDLMAVSLELPNAVAVRSLSKAWGLAGLRVGYAVGPAALLAALRAAGGPYAVSRSSMALAGACLSDEEGRVDSFVDQVRAERGRLVECLTELGASPLPSQANFVLARVPDPVWLRQAVAGLGIAIRAWPGRAGLDDKVRITCPGDPDEFERLVHALGAALAPEALLFDMDGVLADVSGSYREAIRGTLASYGVEISSAEIAAEKNQADSNNDWVVSQRLLSQHGVQAELKEVTERFEVLYNGREGKPGLFEREGLIPERALLERLADKLPLAVVTGRPRSDAERFCEQAGISQLFKLMVCMGESEAKPDPAPVRLALSQLGLTRAWMIGDMPDDVRAARAAGVIPLAVVAPGDQEHLFADGLLHAGAGRVLQSLAELEEVLS